MTAPEPTADDLAELTGLRLEEWGRVLRQGPGAGRSAAFLHAIEEDADAFDFVRDVFEFVAMPRDAFVSALGLRQLSQQPPESLPTRLRIALQVGGIASLGLPWGVVPIVKQRFREHLGDLLMSTSLSEKTLRVPAGADAMLLGRPVLGNEGAAREADRLVQLVAHPEVSRVTLQLGRLAPQLTEWTIDDVQRVLPAPLERVLTACAEHGVIPTISAQNYVEALAAPGLVRRLDALGDSNFSIGLELLAELPESLDLLEEHLLWTQDRSGEGRLEVRVSTRTIKRRETVESLERGLAVPSFDAQSEVDTQFVRLLDQLLRPEYVGIVSVSVATEDPTLLAFAIELAAHRGVDEQLTVALRRSLAPELRAQLADEGIATTELTPVVPHREFGYARDTILDTLSDVVDWNSAYSLGQEIFFRGADRDRGDVLAEQRHRMVDAVDNARTDHRPASHRLQDRGQEWESGELATSLLYRPAAGTSAYDTGGLTAAVLQLARQETGEIRLAQIGEARNIPVVSQTGFACTPDTDGTRAENRDWMRGIITAVRSAMHDTATNDTATNVAPQLSTITRVQVSSDGIDRQAPEDIEELVAAVRRSGESWAQQSHDSRASRVRRAALALAAARDRLVTIVAATRQSPAHEIDFEVNAAIDATRHLAQLTDGLRAVRGATFTPDPLTLIVFDEVSPLSEIAEVIAAALAAGSGVLVVGPDTTARIAAVVIEEWEASGLPTGTARILAPSGTSENERIRVRVLATAVAAHETVDRVLAFGDAELARGLRRRRPDLPIDARVRGVGSMILTSSADLERSIRSVVESAFTGAGGHPLAAKALIVCGPFAHRRADLGLLKDAVESVVVATPESPDHDPLTITMGPLSETAGEPELRALTELAPGESWLVEPRKLDDAGKFWTPGVRLGVKPSASFWADSIRSPVIGVVQAASLADALDVQRELGVRSVAAIYSTNSSEILPWLEDSKAASLVVADSTTRARVERRPHGVWSEAHTVPQPLVGGPNRLLTLGTWKLRSGTQSETLHLRGLDPVVRSLIEAAQPVLDYEQFDRVRRAALADALVWRTHFGLAKDVSNLGTERNVLRYRPVPVHIRFADGADLAELVRVLAAAHLAHAPFTLSSAERLPDGLTRILQVEQVKGFLESDEDWLERAAIAGSGISGEGELPAERIRLIGGDSLRVREWLSSRPEVGAWVEPVTMAGSVELFGFLREQSITVFEARNGIISPIPEVAEWLGSL